MAKFLIRNDTLFKYSNNPDIRVDWLRVSFG